MRFPGQRRSRHYFPVAERELRPQVAPRHSRAATHVVGIDQTLVDITAVADDALLERYKLSRGHSLVIPDDQAEALYRELRDRELITQEFAGGTVGNTLHNYSVLADDRSVLLGVMCEDIRIGSYAYRYLCNTSSRMDLDHLQPVNGPIGRCFALIAEDGERTFAINPGMMNQLEPASIPEAVFADASALVLTAYLLRGAPDEPLPAATRKAIDYARAAGVPVVLTLGTRFVIEERQAFWQQFIAEYVNVLAMNEEEAEALTGEDSPLLACDRALDWADFVLCTAGQEGLYTAGYTDESVRRPTRHQLLLGPIQGFNRDEFSRAMRRADCSDPVRVYAFIEPYMGGPERIRNTNGAGDGALAALLHDLSANRYHRDRLPDSEKHAQPFLTYSSFSQICKYANRVAYEVLVHSSPRLSKGLPEKEEGLDERAYWER